MDKKIENFDISRLKTARDNILAVYNYYYSAPGYFKLTKRLETIINKLDYLIEER